MFTPASSSFSNRPTRSRFGRSSGPARSYGQSPRRAEGSTGSYGYGRPSGDAARPGRSYGSRPMGSRPYGAAPSGGRSGRPAGRYGAPRGFAPRGQASRRGGRSESIAASRYIRAAVIKPAEEVVIPTTKYTDFPLHPSLLANIAKKGYVNPTPIQDQAIPHIMAGKDVVGVANTGTGKTGAFLIPTIEKIGHNPTTKALIIVPTRELAEQIQQELTSLTTGIEIYSTLVIGGASMIRQITSLRRHTHFVIGTPGRIKDLIERKVLNMSNFSVFVLDEVDRMVDMGFIQDIKYLVSLLPEVRQSLFFSATISPDISQVMAKFLKDPVTIRIKSTSSTVDSVNQDVVRVPHGMTKWQVLEPLLKKDGFTKVMIFVRTKRGADDLTGRLLDAGFQAGAIHGDKPQRARQIAVREFKNYQTDILVATDVAARGIDIPDVTHVINYDEPATYDDYVHRIGRTGRAGKAGTALTFIAG